MKILRFEEVRVTEEDLRRAVDLSLDPKAWPQETCLLHVMTQRLNPNIDPEAFEFWRDTSGEIPVQRFLLFGQTKEESARLDSQTSSLGNAFDHYIEVTVKDLSTADIKNLKYLRPWIGFPVRLPILGD